MSFQIINLCAAVQVAVNVFHMFRNNTINYVESREQGNLSLVQYENTQRVPDGKPALYDNSKLEYLSTVLQGDCPEIRVHEMESNNSPKEIYQQRLVEFCVARNNDTSTNVSLRVRKKYYDVDQITGWTDWTFFDGEIKVSRFNFGKVSSTELFKLGKLPHLALAENGGVSLSQQMYNNVRGLVFFR